jgi:hypothetical protein
LHGAVILPKTLSRRLRFLPACQLHSSSLGETTKTFHLQFSIYMHIGNSSTPDIQEIGHHASMHEKDPLWQLVKQLGNPGQVN